MADHVFCLFGTLMFELINEDSDELLCILATNSHLRDIMHYKPRREHLPSVQGYTETVLPRFITEDYRTHFRISKEMFTAIISEIQEPLTFRHRGGHDQISPSKQLFIFLCYMANKETMREIGHYFGVGKSSVHNTIMRVAEVFLDKLLKVIQWPGFDAQETTARENQLSFGLPDIMGYLDGTHIRLSGCPRGDNDFINRKHFPSMQLQVVVDNHLAIIDCYTGWPGCAHDARVLRNSGLYDKAEEGGYLAPNKVIAADSAYPLKHWLVTPFKDNGHLRPVQRRFNRVLSSGRQVVERAIGHLKGRFRRLQEITVHEEKNIASTIVCGCILHNLCILCHDELDQYVDRSNEDDNHPNNHFPNIFQNAIDGVHRREQLMNALP
ncbi:uncharacterized protein [Argopecten irradians]|uniref:uncharacterized protein n=1 Tax=Argopecten irradians TaxID=31199 RepID=UPI003714BD2B